MIVQGERNSEKQEGGGGIHTVGHKCTVRPAPLLALPIGISFRLAGHAFKHLVQLCRSYLAACGFLQGENVRLELGSIEPLEEKKRKVAPHIYAPQKQ